MVIREVMTPDPVTVNVQAPLSEVLDVLLELDVRHVPVVDGTRLVGMISDRDLREHSIPSLLASELPEDLRGGLTRDAAQVMSSDLVCVGPEDDVAEAIDLMVDTKVGAVPVVDPESDVLVGIVSYVDILRAARDAL